MQIFPFIVSAFCTNRVFWVVFREKNKQTTKIVQGVVTQLTGAIKISLFWQISYPRWQHIHGIFSLAILLVIFRHWGSLLELCRKEVLAYLISGFWQGHNPFQCHKWDLGFFVSSSCPRVQVWVFNCLMWTTVHNWIKNIKAGGYQNLTHVLWWLWFTLGLKPVLRWWFGFQRFHLLFRVHWACQFHCSAVTLVKSALLAFFFSFSLFSMSSWQDEPAQWMTGWNYPTDSG